MARIVDTRGHLCPVPIIRTGKELQRAGEGTELEILSDDPAILEDLPAFCKANGHRYLGHREQEGFFRLRVRK